MARRQRVPRHKEHRRKRNKNPKLSPFQREQQRARLANQAPVSSLKETKRDYSISQRAVMEYLMAKRERQEAKKKQREAISETQPKQKNDAVETSLSTSTNPHPKANKEEKTAKKRSSSKKDTASKPSLTDDSSATTKRKLKKVTPSTGTETTIDTKPITKKAKKSSLTTVKSLNEHFSTTLSKPVLSFRAKESDSATGALEDAGSRVNRIIARKKEKKHRKKAEARHERVKEELIGLEKELKEIISKGGRTKRRGGDSMEAQNAALEKELKRMQKEKAVREAEEKREAAANTKTEKRKRKRGGNPKENTETEDHSGEEESSAHPRQRKRVTFEDANDHTTDASHHVMRFPNDKSNASARPREFHELVDVVRFGERVEAPPVFDVVPSNQAAITRLAEKLNTSNGPKSHEKRFHHGANTSLPTRLQLLSSSGGVGETKRLERLGLAPRGSAAAVSSSSSFGAPKSASGGGENAKLSKEEEMRRLREHVVASYRRTRRAEVVQRKGVDMHHEFPLFS